MKRHPALLLPLALLASGLSGQTTFLTTIDSTTPNAVFVYDTQWLARGFTTGANSTGYALDHVNLFLVTPGIPDATFTVQLRADNAGQPGALIGSFSAAGEGSSIGPGPTSPPRQPTGWRPLPRRPSTPRPATPGFIRRRAAPPLPAAGPSAATCSAPPTAARIGPRPPKTTSSFPSRRPPTPSPSRPPRLCSPAWPHWAWPWSAACARRCAACWASNLIGYFGHRRLA